MNFLTDLGKLGGEGDSVGDIGEAILACNPVLESFGNAKTVRNDNSSRFGKYTLMYFALDKDKIYGARIKNYLLEKSRVIKVAANERGYHAFYFLLRGASDDLLKQLYLTDSAGKRMTWEKFFYLKSGGDLSVEHDVGEWKVLEKTLVTLKFSAEQILAIWRCTAAVLLLGQIEFDEKSFAKVEENVVGKIKNIEVVD